MVTFSCLFYIYLLKFLCFLKSVLNCLIYLEILHCLVYKDSGLGRLLFVAIIIFLFTVIFKPCFHIYNLHMYFTFIFIYDDTTMVMCQLSHYKVGKARVSITLIK